MTCKLRQIQALLNPTAGFPEVYVKYVLIKHLTQSLAHHLTKPLTQPFMQPINTNSQPTPQASSHPDPISHPASILKHVCI
jgi:hypothetical protein